MRTVLWQFVNRLTRTYLLLLTATPVQNDLEELFNLVTLLQPDQLKTVRAFRREHVARGDRRQPRDPEGLRRLLAEVMVRNRRATTHVTLPRRIARTVIVEPTAQEQALYRELSDFLRDGHRQGGEITRMLAQMVQMELGSSPGGRGHPGRLLVQRRGAERAGGPERLPARPRPDDAKGQALLELARA
jgi:SNF2 family DNA or RNA helicase